MGGKSGGGSRSPQIAPNTLNSAQKLKVIDLISSGEIAGFINGNESPLESVYLNDTPVQNKDGSMNHAGVQFEFNRGSLDQDYFPSSTSVDNSVSVGVEVEKKTPITRTVTNQQVTSVRVTVGVDALLFTTQTGDQWPASVSMSIQILKDGDIFTSQTMSMWEKGNKPFHQDYVFSSLPVPPFDIRCVRITEDSDDDMLKNKTYFFSYVESVDSKLRMPGTAAVLLQIDSQQFGNNNPSRNYGIKGCIVQVPSNYDPVNRTYTGLWDRLFKPAYTNNPAWVLYDVLTADECLGEKFEDYRIDIDRLYELSKHCDVLVDDGSGGKEPRFVCNMVLFGDDASTVLDNICSIFRGTYSSANNHFTVQFDQKSDPVAVYNNSSVENGEFNYSYVPVTELFNQIKVEYIDKDDGYRTKVDEVSDESNIAKYGLRSTSITAFGATKRSYALRCAKWNLVTALTENETVTFVVGAAGIRHEQHDIIKIADNDYAGAQIGGRIESVNGNTITVDRELQNVKEFMINIDGSVQTFQVVKAVDAKTYQLDTEVNAVDYVQFVATLDNLEPRLFRCIHIEEDSEINKYTITAIKHNPQKEGIVDKGAEYIEGNHSVLNTLPHLSNGIVGTEGRAIVLRWDSLEMTGSENTYVVKLYNGLDFVRRDETKETFIKYENLKSGNYTARIRAVNENGQFSEELVITFSTTYEIDGLRVASIVFGIRLNWDVPELITTDAHTEIWYSKENDRELATKLAKLPYPQNTYTLNGLSVGEEYYFWLRLVDIDGNQGEFTRSLKGQASQDADDILGYLDGKITETQISKDLQDQFNKNIDDAIDVATDDIKESLVSIDVNISDINNDLQTIDSSIEILNAEDMFANIALRTENEARFSQDSILSAATANNSASIEKLDTVVADEFRAIAQREAVINAKIQDNESSIKSISQSVVDNEKAQSIVNSENNAKFNDSDAKTGLSSIALATENNARAQNDSKLSANVGLNNASIERIDAVIVDNEKAQASVNSTIQSQVNSNTSSIETVQSTIATDKQVQAQINSKLESEIGDNKTSIENLNQSFVDEKQSQVVINQKNNAKFNENSALTEFSTIALATENQVRAQNDSKISASVGLNSAEIKRVDDIVVTNEKSQASINTSLQSQVDSNKSSINNIHSTIVTDKEAQAQINNSLSTKIGDNESNINSLNQSFVDEKQSQSVINQKSSAKFNENEAVSDLSSIALATENNARAQNDSKLSANVGANSADIKRIDTVIVDNEKSVAQSIESLESKVGSNESSIKTINNTIVADKTAQSQVNTKQQSQIDGNTSSINLLNKTIVSDKEAQSQINSGLSSQIGENAASITAIQTTTANIDGKVSALYTFKVDANGNIAGMMIGADEYSSMVKFSADKFVVATADQEINMFSLQTIDGKQVAQFNVDDLIAKGSISGDRFIAGTSIEAPIIKGGRVESGHFAGGSINIGNGNFNVDSYGNLNANNGYFGGIVEASEIKGDVTKVKVANIDSAGYAKLVIEPVNFDRVIVFSDLSTNIELKSTPSAPGSISSLQYKALIHVNSTAKLEKQITSVKYMNDNGIDYLMIPAQIISFQHEIKKGEAAVIELRGAVYYGGGWRDKNIFQGPFHALIFKGNL